jgi:hypothetical protein
VADLLCDLLAALLRMLATATLGAASPSAAQGALLYDTSLHPFALHLLREWVACFQRVPDVGCLGMEISDGGMCGCRALGSPVLLCSFPSDQA